MSPPREAKRAVRQ